MASFCGGWGEFWTEEGEGAIRLSEARRSTSEF